MCSRGFSLHSLDCNSIAGLDFYIEKHTLDKHIFKDRDSCFYAYSIIGKLISHIFTRHLSSFLLFSSAIIGYSVVLLWRAITFVSCVTLLQFTHPDERRATREFGQYEKKIYISRSLSRKILLPLWNALLCHWKCKVLDEIPIGITNVRDNSARSVKERPSWARGNIERREWWVLFQTNRGKQAPVRHLPLLKGTCLLLFHLPASPGTLSEDLNVTAYIVITCTSYRISFTLEYLH